MEASSLLFPVPFFPIRTVQRFRDGSASISEVRNLTGLPVVQTVCRRKLNGSSPGRDHAPSMVFAVSCSLLA